MSTPSFTNLIDLAAERLGGKTIACTDDFFAEKENPLFANIPYGSHFYFVHSYFIEYDDLYTLASTDYSTRFSASIWHNNFYGVQFHPEKSGEYGETLLKNFSKL